MNRYHSEVEKVAFAVAPLLASGGKFLSGAAKKFTGKSLGRRALTGAGVGAGLGGLSTVGDKDKSVAKGMLAGATLGGSLGAAAGPRALAGIQGLSAKAAPNVAKAKDAAGATVAQVKDTAASGATSIKKKVRKTTTSNKKHDQFTDKAQEFVSTVGAGGVKSRPITSLSSRYEEGMEKVAVEYVTVFNSRQYRDALSEDLIQKVASEPILFREAIAELVSEDLERLAMRMTPVDEYIEKMADGMVDEIVKEAVNFTMGAKAKKGASAAGKAFEKGINKGLFNATIEADQLKHWAVKNNVKGTTGALAAGGLAFGTGMAAGENRRKKRENKLRQIIREESGGGVAKQAKFKPFVTRRNPVYLAAGGDTVEDVTEKLNKGGRTGAKRGAIVGTGLGLGAGAAYALKTGDPKVLRALGVGGVTGTGIGGLFGYDIGQSSQINDQMKKDKETFKNMIRAKNPDVSDEALKKAYRKAAYLGIWPDNIFEDQDKQASILTEKNPWGEISKAEEKKLMALGAKIDAGHELTPDERKNFNLLGAKFPSHVVKPEAALGIPAALAGGVTGGMSGLVKSRKAGAIGALAGAAAGAGLGAGFGRSVRKDRDRMIAEHAPKI